MKINSIAFFCYPVTDIAKARAFYEGVLGLNVTHNFSDKFIEYDLGDTTFSIGSGAPMMTPGAPGGVVAFEVDNLNEWFAKLKALNVPIVLDVYESPVCHMFTVADPDNNRVMIHQRKASITPVSDAVGKTA